MNKITLTILLIFTESNCFVVSVDKLLALVVYFRHGDRSPEKSFPNDEFFTSENFPMGFGQLTNKGLNRHYDLGQWFRRRYITFLPERYSPNDILVRSTDVDRTLMSAAANLAGLYPPQGDQVWNGNLLWQPIPIHTVAQSDDEILAMKKSCPKYEKLYEEIQYSQFYQHINDAHAELYEYISKHTGLNVTDINDTKLIRSVFYCYENFNSSFVPTWAENLNQTELDYLSGVAYGRHTITDDMKRLRAGPFLYYLINYFKNISNDVEDAPKFLMFSSHDTELVSVLDAMGVYDIYPPGFTATIIWEMREDSEGKKYINLFYRKSEDELLSLAIPGCTFDCQLDDFGTILESVTVDSETWNAECNDEGNI